MTRQRLMLSFIEFTGGLRQDSCLVFSLLTRLCEALARPAERPQSERLVRRASGPAVKPGRAGNRPVSVR